MTVFLQEVFDVVVMTLAVGYIFMTLFQSQRITYGFDWKALWFACMVTAPALILHELAHKFVAIFAGFEATFHAAYTWLAIGVALKMFGAPFIFFVPAYVSIGCQSLPCSIPPTISAIIAFAGPGMNLLLWLTSWVVIKYKYVKNKRWYAFWFITQKINMLLFILNMLPIPGFDGWKVYSGLWQAFG